MFQSFTRLFRVSAISMMQIGRLQVYQQEAFQAQSRFANSTTYPGSIKASTPGDTKYYINQPANILFFNERHYWRAVVDDPQVQHLTPLRIRFKNKVWVTTGWQDRLQVVQVLVRSQCTVDDLIKQVCVQNNSPYLCTQPFTLNIKGQQLDGTKLISEYNINQLTPIDAIIMKDGLSHLPSQRLKDWNVDEITQDDLSISPYKEMGMNASINLTPRWEGKPRGFYGRNNYSGMKQTSS